MPDRLRTARPRAQLRQGRNDWYRITNSIGGGPAQIHVYDEIGYWGITASDFVRELSSLNASAIDLHINSPGGEIFDGIAIMNALRSHPATVTTYVDGIAASIASVIAMAGDRIVMAPHSQLMIHDGSGLCIGNAADMRETADLLDRQSDNIAAVYAERAGGDVTEWRARMTAETWYTAAEAVAAGLADEIASSQSSADDNSPKNSWDLSIFAYAGRDAAPAPVPVATTPAAPAVEPVEPVEETAAEAAPVEPAAAVETPADPEPEPAAPIDDPAPTPEADDWASITAHLTVPAPSPEDAFARLREALL
ncbi:head maturation protease, ClpP-related [Kitasatospora indigofera]|uniref:head maturation protease, ClpP-related n=1 Tax=Kitasatospora indigofera TaxID=67307 RepID=UPI0036C4402E